MNVSYRGVCSRLAFLAAILPVCSCTGPSDPNGSVRNGEYVKLSHDFGSVLVGHDATHVFEIHNRSSHDQCVKGLVTSCRCVASELSHRRIAAGSSATVKLTLSIGQETGTFAQRAICEFLEADAPSIQMHLQGTARRPLQADPNRISINGSLVAPILASFAIHNFQAENCVLTEISSATNCMLAGMISESCQPPPINPNDPFRYCYILSATENITTIYANAEEKEDFDGQIVKDSLSPINCFRDIFCQEFCVNGYCANGSFKGNPYVSRTPTRPTPGSLYNCNFEGPPD